MCYCSVKFFYVLHRGFKWSLDLHTKYRVLCFLRYALGSEVCVNFCLLSTQSCCGLTRKGFLPVLELSAVSRSPAQYAIHSDRLLLSLIFLRMSSA
ncbi:hypothetical protein AHF37_02266 [Paragonimus kellicotti]|nr:hypothetical protein AHF37_02266 [Paragonimus kellicotti]